MRLQKARSVEPDRSSIREALGRAYFALGRWSEAENEFRVIIGLRPADDYAHYCLGRSLSKLGRFDEARTYLRLARALSPDQPKYSDISL